MHLHFIKKIPPLCDAELCLVWYRFLHKHLTGKTEYLITLLLLFYRRRKTSATPTTTPMTASQKQKKSRVNLFCSLFRSFSSLCFLCECRKTRKVYRFAKMQEQNGPIPLQRNKQTNLSIGPKEDPQRKAEKARNRGKPVANRGETETF